jgi:hypothetical protein
MPPPELRELPNLKGKTCRRDRRANEESKGFDVLFRIGLLEKKSVAVETG